MLETEQVHVGGMQRTPKTVLSGVNLEGKLSASEAVAVVEKKLENTLLMV